MRPPERPRRQLLSIEPFLWLLVLGTQHAVSVALEMCSMVAGISSIACHAAARDGKATR
jgi:hypothetical protein